VQPHDLSGSALRYRRWANTFKTRLRSGSPRSGTLEVDEFLWAIMTAVKYYAGLYLMLARGRDAG
jgi:hypothetical protein